MDERSPAVISHSCAWVIGAGGGIGQAVTAALAPLVHHVHACDRNGVPVDPVVTRPSGRVFRHQFDMADQAQAQAFADAAGVHSVPPTLMVIAAGEVSSAAVDDVTASEFDSILRNNVGLAVFSLQAFRRTSAATSGKPKLAIVIGSNAAEVPRPRQPIYAASKAAVRSLVSSLALAWGPTGISVVGIEPGTVMVDRNRDRVLADHPHAPVAHDRPSGRLSTPFDIAALVTTLLVHGDQLTGRSLVFDGGSSLGSPS